MVSQLKLTNKPWTACENLFPLIFFSILILIGYGSVVETVIMLIMGKQYFGDRPDILSKQ